MGVEYTVRDNSVWQLHLNVTGAPDTTNQESGSPDVVRPNMVNMGLVPNAETGKWEPFSVGVVGPKVKDGKVITKRDYLVIFMHPLEEREDNPAPEWLRDLCQDFADRANGQQAAPVEEKPKSVKKVSPQRADFDKALRVLLMRENLDGTEWAIEQLREAAEKTKDLDRGKLSAELAELANQIEDSLDMRTAKLSTQHWRDRS